MFLLAFFSVMALSPAYKIKELRDLVYADSLFVKNFDSLYYHPEIQPLLKEKAFKEALLKQSESDSIQLVINLTDSLTALSIKGVSIHQTKIRGISRDKLLENLPFMYEIKLLSQPLPVRSHYATIVKEPVVVRHAPRDTLEAALNAWQPDTLIQNPAFVSFRTEHGLQIIFEQDKNEQFRDRWKKWTFYNHLRTSKAFHAVTDFLTFTKMEYQPTLTLKIPVDDLRALYRALPENTLIVLKL